MSDAEAGADAQAGMDAEDGADSEAVAVPRRAVIVGVIASLPG